MTSTLVLDTEVYGDYFLASFLNIQSDRVTHLEMFEGHPLEVSKLRSILAKHPIITFNGQHFDLPILGAALKYGATTQSIKSICDAIIVEGRRHWHLDIEVPKCNHIDLFAVAPGRASLKLYGARMHARTLQDLPIEPSASISPDDRARLREYCENDLRTTAALYERLRPQIELREQMGAQYGIDLRSKSDAQIAEAVIKTEVARLSGDEIKKQDPFRLAGQSFKYVAPQFIRFRSAALQDALRVIHDAAFVVSEAGVIKMPAELGKLDIEIGASTYRMGIGGLHSTEKSVAHHAGPDHLLVDRDVASYYPSIILRCGLRPEIMGEHFTSVYRSIVKRRLDAKRAGNKVEADSLKIVINGSFGKFGSPYSVLYSPQLLIQTTITGQLALLMLIEMLEERRIAVVSANTDGVVISCPKAMESRLTDAIYLWEIFTSFTTESTEYRALYAKDVNNYVAIKPDGTTKLRGLYARAGLAKSPVVEIVVDAVLAYLQDGTPVDKTIAACTDITRFVLVRSVDGGAIDHDGTYLGRVVRWYFATGAKHSLTTKLQGHQVPRSEGARALMTLPDEFPADVDHAWYVSEAYSILKHIGAIQ